MYLRVQSFINLTEDNFSKIQYAAFLFRDNLVWSGLEQDDMRIMYSYLVSPMALMEVSIFIIILYTNACYNRQPPKVNTLFQQKYGIFLSFPIFLFPLLTETNLCNRGKQRFVTGPEDMSDLKCPITAPKVFVGPDSKEYYLIVYEVCTKSDKK